MAHRDYLTNEPWHAKQLQETVSILQTQLEQGLSTGEAKTRLEKFGLNELKGKPPATFLQRLLAQFKDFLIIILLIAAVVSLLVGEGVDALVIIGIVLVNAILGVSQESKAEKSLEALQKMSAPHAKVLRDGKVQKLPARELVPGDVVVVEAGDYIPADVRLVESYNLKVEEASLTGESVPVEKRADVVLDAEVPIGDRLNTGFSGTVVTYGRGKGLVTATGMNTQLGLIAGMIQSMEAEDTPLQKSLDTLGKWLGIVTLVVSAIVFVTGMLRGGTIIEMFMTAISLAVAAIPEGLPAVVTIVLALGMERMVKRHVIMRKLLAVETLGSTTVICSDKTGTLTQNEMTAVRLFAGGQEYKVTGEGYSPTGEFFRASARVGDPTQDIDLKRLLEIASLCNDSRLELSGDAGSDATWRIAGDPTEGALVVVAAKAGLSQSELNQSMARNAEIPFDSDRKRMTTVHQIGSNQVVAMVKGAPDVMLDLCDRVSLQGQEQPLTPEIKQKISRVNSSMAGEALRVLATAYKPLPSVPADPKVDEIESNMVFVGLIGMIDPARPEAVRAIGQCKQAGIKPVMITGDYKETAVAIARELGLVEDVEGKVMTGAELEKMSAEELEAVVEDVSVYARVSPEHKVRIVEAFRNTKRHIVAMTGDGVNDAMALKKSDIGVAMGITGTDVAKETADMILTDDNFASIVSAVEEGRIIYSNIRKFVYFLLSCNVGEILVIFVAMLVNLPVPLRPIQLLWLNLVTDSFPALALGMEKGDPGIMKQKPRRPDEPILNRPMIVGTAIQAVALTVAVLSAFVVGLRFFPDNLSGARTMAFATLITAELLRAHTSRSFTDPLLRIGLFSNPVMNWATLLSFVLMLVVLYVPFLEPIFDTVWLNLYHWQYIIGFGAIPFLVAEITKALGLGRGR